MSVLQSFYVDPATEAQRAALNPQADSRPAPSWGEAFEANNELQQDRSGANRALAFADSYSDLMDALDDNAKERIRARTSKAGIVDRETGKMPLAGAGGIVPYRQKIIWDEVMLARSVNPKAFGGIGATQQEYDGSIQKRLIQNRAKNKSVAAREDGWTAGLVGGAVGSLTDPINAASMFVGGPAGGLGKQIIINGLTNMGAEIATLPGANQELAFLGDGETAGEQVQNVLLAGGVGAAFPLAIAGSIKVGGKTIDLSVKGGKKLVDAAGKMLPMDQRIARAMGKESLDQLDDSQIAEIFAQAVPAEYRTPAQADALAVMERQGQIKGSNPYQNTYAALDAHLTKADEALARVTAGIVTGRRVAPSPVAARAASFGGDGFNMGRYLQNNRAAESGGSDVAAAETSSAFGRYQFLKGTWVNYYKRVFGETGESNAVILRKRGDGDTQDKLMQAFTNDNIKTLRNAGVPVTDGSAYLAHFLGAADAVKVMRAGADTPIGQVVRGASINANAAVFGKIRTAGDLAAWADRKMRGQGTVPTGANAGTQASTQASAYDGLNVDKDAAYVRPAALDAVRPVVSTDGSRMTIQQFSPADIEVDAGLMQFKAGGDAQGVTRRLHGVQEWDNISAGTVVVWEGADGRRLIADGHQRLGLAKRMSAADPAQDIKLQAYVLREADGVSAGDARILTALKNIGEGSGSATDAAKIFREGGDMAAEALAKRLPPNSVMVRDGKSLSRLSPEAFGAVVNEVVPESWGAVIGGLAPDPATHMALVDLLHQLDPPNRRQAESIVKQAMNAGFSRETQEELFGSRDVATALFASRAKVLDKGLAELRKLKGVFQVAGRNADTLGAEGSQIDIARADAAASGNAMALEIVERLAYSKGDVADLLNTAAEKLAKGQSLASVVAGFVADVRKLDLKELGRNSDGPASGRIGDAGGAVDGSGRGGFFDDEIQSISPDRPVSADQLGAEGPDAPRDAGGLTAQERATLDFEEPDLGLFDAPDAPVALRQADGLMHDLRADIDSHGLANIEFGVREGAGDTAARTIADMDAEEAALTALRACL